MYYMITHGQTEIESFYIGATPMKAIAAARWQLINLWPKYRDLKEYKILELGISERCEFDLVKINADYPLTELSLDDAQKLYDSQKVLCNEDDNFTDF